MSAARRFAYVAAALVVVAIALAALAPRLVDLPAVRAGLQRELAQVLRGQVQWEALEVRWLPRPHGLLLRPELRVPGMVASADEIEVALRLAPLLRGRVELASLVVERPKVRLEPKQKQDGESSKGHREAMASAVNAIRAFAPDTVLRVEDAEIDLPLPGRAPLELRALSLRVTTGAAGADIQASVSSNLWKRVRATAHVDYASLAMQASAQADGVDVSRVSGLEAVGGHVSLAVKASADTEWRAEIGVTQSSAWLKVPQLPWPISLQSGKAAVAANQVTITQVRGAIGDSSITDLAAQIDLTGAPRLTGASGNAQLGLAQWIPWLRTQFGIHEIADASGALEVRLARLAGPLARPAELEYDVVVVPRRVTVSSEHFPAPILADGGEVRVTRASIKATKVAFAMLDVKAQASASIVGYTGPGVRVDAASGEAQVGFESFPWLRTRFGIDDITGVSGALQVRLDRLSGPLQRPRELEYDVRVAPRKVAVSSKHFPAPLLADGGEVRLTRAAIQVEKVAVSTADAKALASATIRDYTGAGLRVEASATDGELGEKAARWAVERAGAPQFEPETPLRFALQRLAWGPQQRLEAEATLRMAQADMGLAIAWSPAALEVRRLAIKDANSDAVLSALIEEKRVQASFSGVLDVGSVSALFRQALPGAGRITGDVKFAMDRSNPRLSTAQGQIKGENVDLEWLAGKPLRILRLDVTADGLLTRFAELAFEWAGQPATLRGEIRRSATEPVIDARLESPGITLDALLPVATPSAAPSKPAAPGAPFNPWPLPLRGKIEVDAGFIQLGRHRVAPVQGGLQLEPKRAHLDLRHAKSCGLSFPLEAEATPEGYSATLRLALDKEPLEDAIRCMSGESIQISGIADLRAELATRGRVDELLQNLSGTVRADVRDGRLQKFDLLGSILSIANFSGMTELHKAKEAGIPYRTIVVDGRFAGGQFMVDAAGFDSSVLRVAASGAVGLTAPDSQLTVLVAPFSGLDRMVGAIPILGGVLGGVLTTVPVAVSGDIRDPRVVPLGPHAISEQLLGVFERTLKLPGKLVAPAK